jgi:translocation and assembly module TamB
MPATLNVPPAATNVNADYHVSGTPADLTADARFERSTLAGATIDPGSTVGVTMRGKDLAYRADATVHGLALQRIGSEFKVAALAVERYKSDINAHVTASGRGTKPADIDLIANGRLTDTAIMGGRIPQLNFTATLARDNAHLAADGAFAGFDPAAASGKPAMRGMVGGRLSVDATVDQLSRGVTPDTIAGSAKIDLDPSTVAGLEITKANIDADYRSSTADIRAFDVVGRDVNAQASGTLALNDTGQSNLNLHADSPSLAKIGTLVNQPITGIGTVDLTVTGNRRELRAEGTVTGDGVKYGDNGALALTSTVIATVPDLNASHATVSATTHGTFVTVAGQNINDLTAKTDYRANELTFDLTAKQPKRSLASVGTLLLHPDHQEVHLQQLILTSQGLTWQTAPDAKPAIQYGHDAVTVSDLRLVNADQQISASGTYGEPGKELKVALKNVDVGMVDALLLRPPQLSGRLNADATITTATTPVVSASSRTPVVDARFKIDQGGVKQFKYDSFGGTVKYAGDAVTLDTRLQENPTTWLTAKGTAPMALFNGTGVTSHAPVDLHVDSSPVDLGLVQGFTTALTDVRGTFEAHVAVTGTAADPRPDGSLVIQNAAFTVAPTGVVYMELDGRIELQRDRVHIDQIRVLDNQRKPLTLSGDLAVHERELGDVSINLTSDDFKVIDNDMGNVRVNSNLRLTGEINAPRLEGDLGVNTGRLALDPILNKVGTSAYATRPMEIGNGQGADQTGQTAPAPSAFEALVMSVHLTVPDDLVVKADELRAPGASLSLGALNITVGGDLWATKEWGDQVRLTGTVNTVRGTYDFQGRRFTILRDGSVRFDGLDNIDPALDIRTERVIQAVTADVNVKGTLSKPQIELSSTPPLEPADILSLIIFNQPVNQVGEGAQISLAQRAQALATGAVAGQLASSLGRALNLDTLEINTSPDNGATAQITAGQQLGQNLFVKVEESVGDQSQTNFVLEYELTKWLRLQTNVLQGSSTQQQLFKRMQGSGADLLFYFTF